MATNIMDKDLSPIPSKIIDWQPASEMILKLVQMIYFSEVGVFFYKVSIFQIQVCQNTNVKK